MKKVTATAIAKADTKLFMRGIRSYDDESYTFKAKLLSVVYGKDIETAFIK
jgi:phosphopantetheine adenylyltransferase